MDETVVILCGGRGTRLREHTQTIPKPLVEIGGRPILWHVIRIYAEQGFSRFLLCLGHRGELIEEFVRADGFPEGLTIECVDTGEETPTGGRVALVGHRLEGKRFCTTYADGVADIDLAALLDFHTGHGALATMTVVRPELQFGVARLNGEDVVEGFEEKPRFEGWINGGFFCFEPGVLDYLDEAVGAGARAARAAGLRGAAARVPARRILGLHGHLQGCGPAQRSVGSRRGALEGTAQVAAKTATVTRTGTTALTLSEEIRQRFDEFSRSQKDVGQYIVDHLEEAAFHTAEELARRANTSSSTVVRFAQALGFEGFPELQAAARDEYRRARENGASTADLTTQPLFPIDQTEFETALAADHANVAETARKIDRDEVTAAVDLISRAERIVLCGTDQMAFFASYLRHLLMLLDLRAEVVASPSQEGLAQLGRIDEQDRADRLLGRPPASARGARHEAGAQPPRRDDRDRRRHALRGRRSSPTTSCTTRRTAPPTCARTLRSAVAWSRHSPTASTRWTSRPTRTASRHSG